MLYKGPIKNLLHYLSLFEITKSPILALRLQVCSVCLKQSYWCSAGNISGLRCASLARESRTNKAGALPAKVNSTIRWIYLLRCDVCRYAWTATSHIFIRTNQNHISGCPLVHLATKLKPLLVLTYHLTQTFLIKNPLRNHTDKKRNHNSNNLATI